MSEATSATTDAPVTVVCTGVLTATTVVMIDSTAMGLAGVLGQNGSATTTDTN